jgi:hypothetical protein
MQVQLGRYQNRSNRIVEIDSFRFIEVTDPDGSKRQVRIWSGMLKKADGKTDDSRHDYEDSGAFRNQRGVASPMDLSILIEAAPVQPGPAAPAATSKANDPRLKGQAEQLATYAALGLLGAADDHELVDAEAFSETRQGAVEGLKALPSWANWVELVANLVVEVLDAIENKPAAPVA